MMIFSEVHNWQNINEVKQIRVFSSHFAKTEFDIEYAKSTNYGEDSLAVQSFSDTGNGVAYKIRAVLDGNDNWVPLIRCGHTGQLIWETNITENTWQAAIVVALLHFNNQLMYINIEDTIQSIIKSLKETV